MNTIRKPSLAIVSERWVDANPNLPYSTNEGNVYKTAIYSECFSKIDHLFVDKYLYETGYHIDHQLQNTNYDIYYIVFIGASNLNPTAKSLSTLKGKIVFNWPDTVWPWINQVLNITNPYATFHLAHDYPSDDIKKYIHPKQIYTIGTAQNPEVFNFSDKKDIDVSFMGSQYMNRKSYIDYLKENLKCNYYFGSGSRQEKLTDMKYGDIMRRSKICINFTMSPSGKYQLKGRAFESAACNTLLLEQSNPETPKSFKLNEEYIEFTTKEDLLEKINYFLKNEEKRLEIAYNGYLKYEENYSYKKYWQKIIQLLNE